MKSLKDRLDKIESLLKTAGILNEADLHDDLSGDEDELSYDDWAVAHERSKSVAYSSDDSYASLNPSSCDTTHFPGGGDLTPLFKQHEKDDSRYFGESHWVYKMEHSSLGQADRAHYQSSRGAELSGSKAKLATSAS